MMIQKNANRHNTDKNRGDKTKNSDKNKNFGGKIKNLKILENQEKLITIITTKLQQKKIIIIKIIVIKLIIIQIILTILRILIILVIIWVMIKNGKFFLLKEKLKIK